MPSASVPSALRRPDPVPLSDRAVWSLADTSRATRRMLLDPSRVRTALLGD
jgi:hypothetical protein